VAENSNVKLVLSLGDQIAVPPVENKGYSVDTATGILQQAGFTNIQAFARLTTNPDEVNKVVGQDPDPGTAAKKGDLIRIYYGQLAQATTPPTSPSPSPSG
jgi:beta-lactam-binding protein with PASTA domain